MSLFNLFFFYQFIYFFNWKIIALENFVVFCHTSTRISYRDTHVPSLPSLLPHPTLLDCYRAPVWVPWVIQQVPIAIYLTDGIVNFHVTHFIHLTLSPIPYVSVNRSVLYICFSTAALKINSSVPSFESPYICISIWYLYFSFWLTSLSIIGSRFIHLIGNDSNSLLFMAE